MESITYSEFRRKLADTMDRVADDRAPVLITRRGGRPAVLLSVEDYESYEETLHLLRSPRNAARLEEAIQELRSGGGSEHELAEA